MKNWHKKIIEKWIKHEYGISYVVDLPDNLKTRVFYIVGQNEFFWLIAFICPCGCKNSIQLNLLKDANPCWSFSINIKGKINIFPSIWRTHGCKSHFIVRKSKIFWVRNL